MFKIINAELKKIVSKPGIYVLAILLAVILVLGVFIYEPSLYQDNTINLSGSFDMQYSDYVGNGVNSGIKVEYDDLISDATESVARYNEGGSTTKDKIDKAKQNFETYYNAYKESSVNDSSSEYIATIKNNLLSALRNLNTIVSNAINATSQGSYLIVTTTENYREYNSLYDEMLKIFDVTATKEQISEICHDYEQNLRPQFNSVFESFIYPNLSEETINKYTSTDENSRLTIITNRLEEIHSQIVELNQEFQADTTIDSDGSARNELGRLVNLYASTARTYSNLVRNELLSNAFSFTSTNEQLNLLFLDTESEYNANSLLIKYDYLFDNNKTEDEFANPLTIGVTSNNQINAYDYAYFILKLFSFILIVYAIMSTIHAISGEIKDGSMRYLAIRPVSRYNILFGKLLAVFIMTVIMTIFSAIIALLVGGAVYGFYSLEILTIFNSSVAITMHPLVMIVVFLVSLLLEVLVYMAISALLATLLKSDLFAVTIMLVFYIINVILPIVFGGINSGLAFYPFSHISLYALFGSSIYAVQDNLLNNMLGEKIYAGSNIILTIAVILLIVVICNFISARLFKKKEL